jgi:hypothetical protein
VPSRGRLGSVAVVAAALAFSLVAVWLRTWPTSVNDFGREALAAYAALTHGHPLRFLALAPAYGGSLELRSPFALLAAGLGGGDDAVYRLSAVPCLAAAALLGAWLARRAGTRAAAVAVLAVAALNPLSYRALMIGHPEELLGAALCVAAVLAAMRARAGWAGLLLGLAIANKQWAVLAAGPVLIGLPDRRGLAMLLAGAVAAAFLLPLALAAGGGVAGATGRLSVNDAGSLFNPPQLWWFLGHPGAWIPAMSGQIPRGYRMPPDWLQGRAHFLVVLSALPLTELARRHPRGVQQPLLLLALLMLLRCALDPWDVVYYPLPFVLALLAWEVCSGRSLPVLAVAATAAAWLVFELLPDHVDVDTQAIAFALIVVPALAVLARGVYGPRALAAPRWRRGPGLARAA